MSNFKEMYSLDLDMNFDKIEDKLLKEKKEKRYQEMLKFLDGKDGPNTSKTSGFNQNIDKFIPI